MTTPDEPTAKPALPEPIPVFSHGPWLFQETGQSFTGAELDAACFAKYRAAITNPYGSAARVTLQERINQLVQQHGSLRAVARVTEIDAGYLSRLRSGEKARPESAKLRRLGLRRVIAYELIGEQGAAATAGAQGEGA